MFSNVFRLSLILFLNIFEHDSRENTGFQVFSKASTTAAIWRLGDLGAECRLVDICRIGAARSWAFILRTRLSAPYKATCAIQGFVRPYMALTFLGLMRHVRNFKALVSSLEDITAL